MMLRLKNSFFLSISRRAASCLVFLFIIIFIIKLVPLSLLRTHPFSFLPHVVWIFHTGSSSRITGHNTAMKAARSRKWRVEVSNISG